MQKLALWLINIYQKIPGPWHDCCRFYPSCSNYAKEAITNYGFIKGFFLAIKRILRCNPFGGCGYNPVPKLECKKKNLQE